MNDQIYAARSLVDMERFSEQMDGLQVLAQLRGEELNYSASRWTVRHLVAYRLLIDIEVRFLEITKDAHDSDCGLCTSGSISSQFFDPQMTDALIDGPHALNIFQSSESTLMRSIHGPFWAALARACRPEEVDKARIYPQRERRQVDRAAYVNSTTAILGSSSSPTRPSSSEYEVGSVDFGEDDHDARRHNPEEVTVCLVSCFLQHALHLCLVQGHQDMEFRLRVERNRVDTSIAGTKNIVAIDDGGICQMVRQADGWKTSNASVALIEAKKAFRYIQIDDRTGTFTPVVSNETTAQYLGEAVVTWKENQAVLQKEQVPFTSFKPLPIIQPHRL